MCYVSFLFLLRLPSEALPLFRALPEERLLSDDPMSNKATIGLRDFNGEQRLVLRLTRRKNTRHGLIAMRPCFCGKNKLLPQHCCPIHIFWVNVMATTKPGEPLFPSLQGKNINRIPRATLKNIGTPDAEKYSTHCLRRGAANAIFRSGSTLSEIMRTTGWSSQSFRVYLDLQKAEEHSTKSILAGGDSILSETSSATVTPKMKHRKIANSTPFFPTLG